MYCDTQAVLQKSEREKERNWKLYTSLIKQFYTHLRGPSVNLTLGKKMIKKARVEKKSRQSNQLSLAQNF